MADSPWTDLFRGLAPPVRLATVGAIVIPASMLFPWYGIPFTGGLAKTGFDSFGLGQMALLLTVGATLVLIVRCARGHPLPRPLSEGGLIAAGGVWSALVIGYLMLDRPDRIASFTEIQLRYGIFLAMGGAVAMIVGGLRLRSTTARAESRRSAA